MFFVLTTLHALANSRQATPMAALVVYFLSENPGMLMTGVKPGVQT
jgi:hypothetical protein